jgi:hypothetical protein
LTGVTRKTPIPPFHLGVRLNAGFAFSFQGDAHARLQFQQPIFHVSFVFAFVGVDGGLQRYKSTLRTFNFCNDHIFFPAGFFPVEGNFSDAFKTFV